MAADVESGKVKTVPFDIDKFEEAFKDDDEV